MGAAWDGLLDISSAWAAQDRSSYFVTGPREQSQHFIDGLGDNQRRNLAKELRQHMGNPGPPLVPGFPLPLAPGFARYTPVLGFFPSPPGVGFPWPALAQEWGLPEESSFCRRVGPVCPG